MATVDVIFYPSLCRILLTVKISTASIKTQNLRKHIILRKHIASSMSRIGMLEFDRPVGAQAGRF